MSRSKSFHDLWKYDGLVNNISILSGKNNYNIYLSPASNSINVQEPITEDVYVYDISGKIVLLGKFPLNIEQLSDGIYTVKCLDEKFALRFIIQH